jgi:hypothetical protein
MASGRTTKTVEFVGDVSSVTKAAQRMVADLERAAEQIQRLNLGKGIEDLPATAKVAASKTAAQLKELQDLQLAKKTVRVEADISQARKDLERFANSDLRDLGDRIQGIGTKTSLLVTGPLALLGAQSVRQFAELKDSVDAVNAEFGRAGSAIEEFGSTAARNLGLSKREVNEFALSYSALLRNAGIDEQKLAELSIGLTERVVDVASRRGKSSEEVSTAIVSGLAGETEGLRRIGVAINAAAVEQEALRASGKRTAAELTEGEKILARYELIMRATGLAAGDFSDTIDSLPNKQKIANAEAANAATTFGEQMAPAVKAAQDVAIGAARAFGALSPEMRTAVVAGGAIVAAFGPVATTVGTAVKGVSSMKDALGDLRGADGQLTRIGTALAGLGVAATVVGGVLAVKAALDGIERSRVNEKADQIRDALAGVGEISLNGIVKEFAGVIGRIDDVREKHTRAFGESGTVNAELVGLEAKVNRFNAAFRAVIESGNISGAQQLVREFTAAGLGNTDTVKKMRDEIDRYVQSQRYANQAAAESAAIINGQTGALDRNADALGRVSAAQSRINAQGGVGNQPYNPPVPAGYAPPNRQPARSTPQNAPRPEYDSQVPQQARTVATGAKSTFLAMVIDSIGQGETGPNAINLPGRLLAGDKDLVGELNAWCQQFVNAALRKSGATRVAGTGTFSTRADLKAYERAGLVDNRPDVGDLAYKSRGPDPDKGHVGVVTAVRTVNGRTQVQTVEGNSGNRVAQKWQDAAQWNLGFANPFGGGGSRDEQRRANTELADRTSQGTGTQLRPVLGKQVKATEDGARDTVGALDKNRRATEDGASASRETASTLQGLPQRVGEIGGVLSSAIALLDGSLDGTAASFATSVGAFAMAVGAMAVRPGGGGTGGGGSGGGGGGSGGGGTPPAIPPGTGEIDVAYLPDNWDTMDGPERARWMERNPAREYRRRPVLPGDIRVRESVQSASGGFSGPEGPSIVIQQLTVSAQTSDGRRFAEELYDGLKDLARRRGDVVNGAWKVSVG